MDGALCMSGLALGAAVSSLILGRNQRGEEARNQDVQMMLRALEMQQEVATQRNASQGAGVQASRDRDYSSKSPAASPAPEKPEVVSGQYLGFSMEDARKCNKEAREMARKIKPAEVLQNLQRGNARFWTGNATRPEKSAFARRALIAQQFPSTAILACSDSRVPTEIVFDQSLGDMFVCRVAGNCLDTATMASLQYAVKHLEVKVLVVMGHEGCGAVKAAMLPIEKIDNEPAELSVALKGLKKGLEGSRLTSIGDTRAFDREAVVTNVKRQVEDLCKNATIADKIKSKELIVAGAFYEISSGIVDFLKEMDHASLIGAEPEAEECAPQLPEKVPEEALHKAAENAVQPLTQMGSANLIASGGTDGMMSETSTGSPESDLQATALPASDVLKPSARGAPLTVASLRRTPSSASLSPSLSNGHAAGLTSFYAFIEPPKIQGGILGVNGSPLLSSRQVGTPPSRQVGTPPSRQVGTPRSRQVGTPPSWQFAMPKWQQVAQLQTHPGQVTYLPQSGPALPTEPMPQFAGGAYLANKAMGA